MQRTLPLSATILGPLLLALVALVAWPTGPARAQTATMDLVPAAARFHHPTAAGLNSATITPDNPAALAWATDDAAAIGAVDGTRRPPGPGPEEEQAGRFYGARFVGDVFGLGLEYLAVDQVTPPNTMYDRVVNAQLSLRMGWLALGVGAEEVETEAQGAGFKTARSGGGLSIRLWDVLYLGAARYTDEMQGPTPPAPVKRFIDMAGIALRTRGSVQWYLAFDVIDQDPFPGQPGLKTRNTTVQVNMGGFLLGVAAGAAVRYGPGATPPGLPKPPDIATRTVDIGWAPDEGWNLTLRMHRLEFSPGDQFNQSNSLALTRRF